MLAHGATWTRNIPTLRSAHFVAENSGSIEMLQWLDEQGQLDRLRGLVIKAAGSGFADTVRWLLDRGVKNSEEEAELEWRPDLLSTVSRGLHKEFKISSGFRNLRLTLAFWDTALISSQTMLKASEKGYLGVVQWLYTDFGDDPDIDLFSRGLTDSLAMDNAASNGYLSVLQYAHEVQLAMKLKKKTET